MGTPPHKTTQENKNKISALKSFGNTHEDIARYLKMSIDTLEKHYRRELDTGLMVANQEVANKLYKKATKDEDLTAIIFWLKTRARWRTEDAKLMDSNEEIKKEILKLREDLDAKNRKDY